MINIQHPIAKKRLEFFEKNIQVFNGCPYMDELRQSFLQGYDDCLKELFYGVIDGAQFLHALDIESQILAQFDCDVPRFDDIKHVHQQKQQDLRQAWLDLFSFAKASVYSSQVLALNLWQLSQLCSQQCGFISALIDENKGASLDYYYALKQITLEQNHE